MPAHHTDWEKLGLLLVRRRVERDPRWRNRRTFAAEAGIGYHVAYRLEKGLLANVEEATKAVIERAYRLVPGSFDRTMKTGCLEPAAEDDARQAAPGDGEEEDEFEVAALRHELEIETLKREMAELRLRLRDLEAQAAGEGRSWQPRRRPAG